jgi:riboflavin biosynthesis pyrimidine reductase
MREKSQLILPGIMFILYDNPYIPVRSPQNKSWARIHFMIDINHQSLQGAQSSDLTVN